MCLYISSLKYLLILISLSCLISCVTETRVLRTGNPWTISEKTDTKDDLPKSRAEIAKDLFQKYKKDPKNPKYVWAVGEYYFALMDYTKAEYWFRHAIKLQEKIKSLDSFSGSFYLYFYLGKACMGQGKGKEALEFFEKTINVKQKIAPLYVEFKHYRKAHYYLGILYRFKRNLKKSNFHFNEFVRLGGDAKKAMDQIKQIEISKNL